MAPGRTPRQHLLASALGRVLAIPACRIDRLETVGGGSVDTALRIDCGGQRFFVKHAAHRARLDAEADGLDALARCGALRVPAVIGLAELDEEAGAVLVLEHLELSARGDPAALGRAIAVLHEIPGPRFGWHRDNFIGMTPQANGWMERWGDFFIERRLRPQFELLAAGGDGSFADLAAPLLDRVPRLFAAGDPAPGLLHGDLWHGNAGFVSGRPTIFDPAVHFGDAECDLAMAELFGGFAPAFFSAYRERHPEPPGSRLRRRLYQLYHVLNHANMFGAPYTGQARQRIRELVGEMSSV